jgi:hypothetical protein
MLALGLGCVLLIATGICRWAGDPEPAWTWDTDDGLAHSGQAAADSRATSLLVAQAEAFAAHLKPAAKPETASEPMPATDSAPLPSASVATAALKLHATSCYPDQPGKSMALVSGVGGEPQDPKWVKEGSQFGSFQIHEIRRGGIVYRQGDQLREVAIDHSVERPSIVRDASLGLQKVSAAIDSPARPLPTPAGPNDITINGN